MDKIIFEPWPKLARLTKDMVITEKLDGTNAQVIITDNGEVGAGSRTRLITPDQDNYGFARWVEGNKEELLKLGPGRHFGEWWGQGIQRGYNKKEKSFSLFNSSRWNEHNLPGCCSVVPVIHTGPFDTSRIDETMETLKLLGSYAAPGFMNPEGVVVYHLGSGTMWKKTFEFDNGKWAA